MVVIAAGALVMVQAASAAVHDFSHDLPQIVDRAKQSDLGNVVNKRSGSLDTLAKHTGEITRGAGKVSAESPMSGSRLSEQSPSSSP